MNRLPRMATSVLISALTLVLTARADDGAALYQALKADYEAANTKFQEDHKAKGPGAVYLISDSPRSTFAPRFLQFAKDHPDSPEAVQALSFALVGGPDGYPKGDTTWVDTLRLIQERFVANPAIKDLCRSLAYAKDDASAAVLRAVLARNPDRDTRGLAAQTLVRRVEQPAQFAEMIRSSPDNLKEYKERAGKAKLDEMLAKGDRARSETNTLKESFRGEYADFFPTVEIGQPAPEVVSHDLDDHEVRLSALKGKVVVLDIWATWCPPCRAMIPHEREMVERFKDKPFTLVSISVDTEKTDLTSFLVNEPMPWTHWWNGPTGGMVDAWDVYGYPTIYVLDAQGVIRHKDLRGDELEKAVEALLVEQSSSTEKP